MRFRAPRSQSPSPVRQKSRHTSTFGLQSDSDSEEYYSEVDSTFETDDDDSISITSSVSSSSSGSSFILTSEVGKLSINNHSPPISRPPLEQRYIDETVASIRLRTRYHDPYEEWEKQIRKDALKAARKELADTQAYFHKLQDQKHAAEQRRLEVVRTTQLTEMQNMLDRAKEGQQNEEIRLRQTWKIRDQMLWERIEAGIKAEEERLAKRLEEERRVKEEEDRKRKEAELKEKLAEEKRLQEEKARKKAEEEKKRLEEETQRKEKEAEEKRKKREDERQRRDAEEVGLRTAMSFSLADDDWRVARENLHSLKQPVRYVKSNKELKSAWGILRRQIVPKIGQLTNDPQAISRISTQIIEIIKPPGPPHDDSIYIAACYSLAKCILLQAETEVTAEKRSAIPLAQVTFTFLEVLEHFPSIFFSKLVQRCGGWPIPLFIGNHDHNKQPWTDQAEYSKAVGYRKSARGDGLETTEEYSNRVSGIMRVYFHILKIRPAQKPLDRMFQLPRYWTWLARILNDRKLLAQPIAPQLIYTALDVLGLEAKSVWGQQWDKMLHLIETGVTTGYEDNKLIGGNCAEGSAARTRVILVLENL